MASQALPSREGNQFRKQVGESGKKRGFVLVKSNLPSAGTCFDVSILHAIDHFIAKVVAGFSSFLLIDVDRC